MSRLTARRCPRHQTGSGRRTTSLVKARLTGGSDADGDPLTYTIDGVTQDEPVNETSKKTHKFDAKPGESPGEVFLRGERLGNKDGRVYRIAYKLSDGTDSCTGVAKVTVPPQQRQEWRGQGLGTAELRLAQAMTAYSNNLVSPSVEPE